MNFPLQLLSPRAPFDTLASHPEGPTFSQRWSRPLYFAVAVLSVALFVLTLALFLQRKPYEAVGAFVALMLAQVLQHRLWTLRPLAQLPDECARAAGLVEKRPSCAAVRDAVIRQGRHLMVGDFHRMLNVNATEQRKEEEAATAAYTSRYGDGKSDRLSNQASVWRVACLASGAMFVFGFLSLLVVVRVSGTEPIPVATLAFEGFVLALIPLTYWAAVRHEALLPVAKVLHKAKRADALVAHPVVGLKLTALLRERQTLRAQHLQAAERELTSLDNPCKKLHGIQAA